MKLTGHITSDGVPRMSNIELKTSSSVVPEKRNFFKISLANTHPVDLKM